MSLMGMCTTLATQKRIRLKTDDAHKPPRALAVQKRANIAGTHVVRAKRRTIIMIRR
jgi:hypothetical protein